jgi:hypothetical protein
MYGKTTTMARRTMREKESWRLVLAMVQKPVVVADLDGSR